MAVRPRTWALGASALVLAAAAILWWQGGGAMQPGAEATAHAPAAASNAQHGAADPSAAGRGADARFFTRRPALGNDDKVDDPLLTPGLRDTLEALLMEAGDASNPAALKQRLAALIGQHFPAALATRALALAERYVDYRVSLGQLRAPQDLTDPRALREALQARHKVRQQFFDDREYDALFAREDDLDRYTLARLEIARNPQLTAEQRAQALQAADNELPAQRRAERRAATEHMAAAAQTAAFNASNADEYTRYAARSAQYGTAAAQALAQLDREEQHWNQRLDQYQQARTQQGEGPSLQRLRQQLFSPEEQQRIDAALALRQLTANPSGS